MNIRFALLIMLFLSSSMHAMEKIPEKQEIEISLGTQVIYIGLGEDRTKLEQIYDRTFPLNAIFFAVKFRNYRQKTPDSISYDDIKSGTEDGVISLKLNGSTETIHCKQKRDGNTNEYTNFEEIVQSGYERFKQVANALNSGFESLMKEEVVIPEGLWKISHGKKGYPFDEDNNN